MDLFGDPAQSLRAYFDLLTEDELALLVGVLTSTLQVWRVEDKGPRFTKLGKSVFYRRDDVRDWINRSVVRPTWTDPGPPTPLELDEAAFLATVPVTPEVTGQIDLEEVIAERPDPLGR